MMTVSSITAFIFAVLSMTGTPVSAQDSEDPVFVYPDIYNDPERDAFYYASFPDGFAWSSATSSYQIEGGWDADGKGENIWDAFSHEAGNVDDGDTGDVACDSYNKWQKDIELMTNLNLKNYRFSISWARVLPNGTADHVNEAGVEYYNTLINDLIAAGIEPYVTLYHWDLPQALVDSYGGWLGDEIVDDFGDYARLCYDRFGDRVKYWITLNEPWVVAQNGYEYGEHAPGNTGAGVEAYVVSHNLIRSHARAWHVYDDDFRAEQNGVVGITFNSDWFEPENRSDPIHLEASERMMQFMLGWYAHPIFLGDYPDVMKSRIADLSEQQNLPDSRLPLFTNDEVEYVKETSDFFGLNHYTSRLVNNDTNDELNPPSWDKDCGVNRFTGENWPRAESNWLYVVPWGIRRLLAWIKNEYNDPPIYVTENGFSTADIDELDDVDRVNYYRSYINEVLKAIDIDEADVRAYTAWSLMDNFEWARGYRERFGMHYVDFTDDERPRTQKASAQEYMKIVAANGFLEISSACSLRIGVSVFFYGFLLKAIFLKMYGY
ncbi:cytosolic beta-glucosidase-like [Ptychodera flava]|uniref:cytosolic beta-glucosidase-like n=1 Tax=Ptychodera flava TaxID=63121 RepID=UPI00396A4C84